MSFFESNQIQHLGLDLHAYRAATHWVKEMEVAASARLRNLFNQHHWLPNEVYIGHSGGKDSVAITRLVDTALPDHGMLIVHTPKPGEVVPATVDFLYGLRRPVLYCPKEHHKGLGFKVQIDGTRRAEHSRTDGRSTNLVMDGNDVSRDHMPLYVKNGLFGLDFIFPIFDWTDEEVWAYILTNEIPFSEEYLHALDRGPTR